ncbi:glutathione transferase GST 23-like isoform X2 [Phragmites australis]|uniref:glutathione transferase GST 23-like isoform X2 n=1 Tax=Phragmites australis TaxID=29695 RepID=UPI002D769B7B|nr:glutathione transferase GST 23-like isoform X2 [Phragmites australis]
MNHQDEKDKVKLFGIRSSPYVLKVIWALRIKGVKYDYIEEDLGNKSDLLLEYNPVHKKVPVLVYQGKPIAESEVILEFIDEAWKHCGDPILPEDPYERAMTRFWARFGSDKLSPPIWKWFTTQGQEQEDAYAAAIEQLLVLEKELCGKRFFAGEKIGFVDLSLGSLAYVIPIYEEITGVKMITEETFPSLTAWMGNFQSSPVVKDHLPPLDKLQLRLFTPAEAAWPV